MLCVMFPAGTAPQPRHETWFCCSCKTQPLSPAQSHGSPGRVVVRISPHLGCGSGLHVQGPRAKALALLGAISPRTEALVSRDHRRSLWGA